MTDLIEQENAELYDLFLAFDEISASEELKSSTLERISIEHRASGFKAVAGGVSETSAADTESTSAFSAANELATSEDSSSDNSEFVEAPAVVADETSAVADAETPIVAAPVAHKKTSLRSRWRAIRVAAVAACLAFALTGGAAYALPVSYATVSQGDSSIELGINCFGITVSATSNDDRGRDIIETVDLCNISCEDALSRAYSSMASGNPDSAVDLVVRSNDANLKTNLENEGNQLREQWMSEHEDSSNQASSGQGAVDQADTANGTDSAGDTGSHGSESVAPRNEGEGAAPYGDAGPSDNAVAPEGQAPSGEDADAQPIQEPGGGQPQSTP